MKSHFKKNFFFYFLISLLGGGAAFFYFYGEYRLAKLQDWVEDQRQEVNFYASQAVDSASATPLHLVAQSLGWAVRTEILNENKKEVERYLRELGRESSIKMAVLCDTAGVITEASDISYKAKPFIQYHDPNHLSAEIITVKPATNHEGFFLIAPIMGLNTRYGTLFIHYNPAMTEVFKALPKWEEGVY